MKEKSSYGKLGLTNMGSATLEPASSPRACHWANSSTNPTYTLTVTANTTLVAYYNTP